jgi:DNA-entry nuclease
MAAKRRSSKKQSWQELVIKIIVLLVLAAGGYYGVDTGLDTIQDKTKTQSVLNSNASTQTYISSQELLTYTYDGSPYVLVDDGLADFSADEIEEAASSYEYYSDLDSLNRCGVTMASLSQETMPAQGEERGSISSVKPSGWVQKEYDTSLISTKMLYNRSHLIGWQLSAENANQCNLITGTRYLNTQGMLPFENMVADYLKEASDAHVLYRVTPLFQGNELVARGVRMEAYSVEDAGESINYDVWCFNVQPGIEIDYETGESWLAD